MKVIELSKGQVAIVDDEDFERIAQYRWCTAIHGKLMYARRTVYILGSGAENPKYRTEMMHDLILPPNDGFVVDHKNGNSLDNRRQNLRYATRSQNRVNSVTNKNSTTGHNGVYYRSGRSKPWCTAISIGGGKKKYIGYYATREEAISKYLIATTKQWGEFVRN